MADDEKTVNIQLAASVEFMKADLLGAFESTGDRKLFVAKQLNAGEKAKGIRISTLAETIAKAVGVDASSITLPSPLDKIAESYEACVKQVYLKVEKEGNKDMTTEYALWLTIEVGDEALEELKKEYPLFDLVALKGIALKVWNTNNSKVKEEMNFVDIKELAGIAEDTKQLT